MKQRDEITQQVEQALPPGVLEQLTQGLQDHKMLVAGVYSELRRRPQPFDADVVVNSFCVPRDKTGVVRWIHNPGANALQVTLSIAGDIAPPRFSRNMAPGESLHLYLRFAGGLYASAGAGAVLGGEFDA